MPCRSASSSAASRSPSSSSASHRSTWPGTVASSSRARRVGWLSPASRASTASRTVAGTSTPGLASTSVTKKGLPAVAASTAAGRPGRRPAARPRRPTGAAGKPSHLLVGEGGQDPVQGVLAAQLVLPVGEHQHAGQVRDPPGQVAEHVKGGVVGPVDVLDQHHRRAAGQLLMHGPEHRVPPRPRLDGRGQRRRGPAGHVPERPKGPRGDQVVAGPGEHPGPPRRLPGERPDQAGLADPGLTGDERDRASTLPGPPERLAQPAKLGVPLQQARRHRAHD